MLESNEPDFSTKKQPTGLEEDWPERRINLLNGLYTSASYLADVAYSAGDLATAELATDVMTKTIRLQAYAIRDGRSDRQ